jgi:hypothetical protein
MTAIAGKNPSPSNSLFIKDEQTTNRAGIGSFVFEFVFISRNNIHNVKSG